MTAATSTDPRPPTTGVVGWPRPVPPGRALGWAGDLRRAEPVAEVLPPAVPPRA